MAANGADAELDEQLKDLGARLNSAPDDSDGLLKLLDEVEACLLKVEQSPPRSTSEALRPAMAALVKKELLGHSNADVKVAVASCISEITRITAPEAPYADATMKDVFSVIVGAFKLLDGIESPFFEKRASVLETLAKVRSCVVMLDLELDDLIHEMFDHFFRTVSPNHPESVVSSMITTMKLVIDEGEDSQTTAVASSLLQNVKKEKKATSPASFELAEKVIESCEKKLKPILLQLLQGTPLNEYSEIVTSLCEDDKAGREDDNVEPSEKDAVDDGKLSERTISDELPQESSKLEEDVTRPEQDGTPAPAISGGAPPVDKDKDQNLKPSCKSEVAEDSSADINKEAPVASGELSADTKVANGVADDASKLDYDSTPDVVKPKRGRPPGPKSLEKKAARKKHSSGLDLKKAEEASDSAGKSTKRSAKDDVKSYTRKAGEGESSKKQQKIRSKLPKDETLSEEDAAEEKVKEMVSPKSVTKGSGRTKGQTGENSEVKRKREQDTEEAPRSRKSKGLDGSLVGARIKVWWPDDEMFYKGVVGSFDATSKRHKVVYDDGDVEVLMLRDEKWEFVGEEQDKTPDVASQMRRGRKGRGTSVQPPKEGNTETPKSDGGDLPKKRGRPKGWRPSNGTPSTTPSKSKGKTASKDAKGTPKTGSGKEGEKGPKDKAARSTDKTKDDLPKDSGNQSASKPKEVGSKSGEGKAKPGRKPKADVSVKEKQKDKEDETAEMEQEASGKSGEGKARPGRKPKAAGTPGADEGSVKEKRKLKEADAAEMEQEASGKSSAGKKRRRKA